MFCSRFEIIFVIYYSKFELGSWKSVFKFYNLNSADSNKRYFQFSIIKFKIHNYITLKRKTFAYKVKRKNSSLKTKLYDDNGLFC